ncbi:MAG: porin [Alphaproteobacteria bacterium]|nr:porin [Alphaproteobacteria bacterium]
MKRSWRALTAASLFSLAALPASAAELTFAYGGQGNLSGFGIDQDDIPGGDVNNFGFAAEGKIWGRASSVTDSGIEYGIRAQLRFQSSEHEFSNDLIHGAPDFVDEVWAYVNTAFGRVTVGLEDGAGDSAGIYSPTVSDINRIDDPRAYVLQDPRAGSFTAFEPNGAHMRTDLNGSGDAFKVIYYSPRIIGVQLSASYMPELSRGLNDLFNSKDEFDEQSDIWEVGVNYQGSLSSFDVGFYGAYVAGSNERETIGKTLSVVAARLSDGAPTTFTSAAFTPDDLEEWGAGAQVAYEGFKVGGSYRSTNIAGGAGLADQALGSPSVGCSTIAGCVLPDSQTTIWGAGVTYETGPWRFGANYVNLEEELPAFIDTSLGGPGVRRELTQDAQGWSGTVGYEVDENLSFSVGYQHYDFDGPAGVCVGAACDTLDANLGFFQTSMSF